MKMNTRVITILQLIALAYLGFYVWGLALSVFSPGELGILSVLAGVLLVGLVVSIVVQVRTRSGAESTELKRTNAQLRERRGF